MITNSEPSCIINSWLITTDIVSWCRDNDAKLESYVAGWAKVSFKIRDDQIIFKLKFKV